MKPYMTDAQKIREEIVRLEKLFVETFIEILKLRNVLENTKVRKTLEKIIDMSKLEERLKELEKTYEELQKSINEKYRELLRS